MDKYIDAEELIAEIKRQRENIEGLFSSGDCSFYDGSDDAYDRVLGIINYLRQEQPECIYGRTLEERKRACKYCSAACNARIEQEQPEVDIEEEAQDEYYKYAHYESGSISGEGYHLEAQGHYECYLTRNEFKDIARHFYELGLKERKEE